MKRSKISPILLNQFDDLQSWRIYLQLKIEGEGKQSLFTAWTGSAIVTVLIVAITVFIFVFFFIIVV